MEKVLIIYHYFAHYRLPIMRELVRQREVNNIGYTFMSGITTDDDINTIDPELAELTIDQGGLEWKIIKNIWISKKLLWQKGLLRAVILEDYACIIFLGSPYFITTWLAIPLAKLLGKKVLLWTHGAMRGNSLKDKLRKVQFSLSDGLLLYGNWAMENLAKFGFDKKKLFVIYNSLDYDTQVATRNALKLNQTALKKSRLFTKSGYPTLIFVGRLTPQKQIDLVIDAIDRLRQSGFLVNFLIIGDGTQRQELEKLVEIKNLNDHIVFYGECFDENELASLIAFSDICVSPGNVGLTAIHSLVYGTPVITHDNPLQQMPEFEAIIHGITGMLFEQGSLDSLVDMIADWIRTKSLDREEVRKRCYEVIDRFYNPHYQAKMINFAVNSVLSKKH